MVIRGQEASRLLVHGERDLYVACDPFSMIFFLFAGGVFIHSEAGFDTEIIEVTKEGTVSVADGPRLSFTLAKQCMVR